MLNRRHTGRLRKRDNLDNVRGGRRWERSQTIQRRKSLVIYKSFNTLWFYVSQLLLARKHCEISPDMCAVRSGFHKWSSLTWSYSDSPGVGAWVGATAGAGAGGGAGARAGAGAGGEHSNWRTPEGMEASRSCYTPFTESSAANWPVALFFFSPFRNLHCFFLSLRVTISFDFRDWNEWSQVTQGLQLSDTLFIT